MGTNTCIEDRDTDFMVRLQDEFGNRVQHEVRVKSGRERIDEDTNVAKAKADVEKKSQEKKKSKRNKAKLLTSDEETRLMSAPLVDMLDISPLDVIHHPMT
jgi:hypothetical protein